MIKEFIELSKDTGQYNDTVQVICSPHTGRANREVIVTGTTAAGESDVMTVTQQAKEQFLVLDNYNEGTVTVPVKGETYTIKGRSNMPMITVLAQSTADTELDIVSVDSQMILNGDTYIESSTDGTFSMGTEGLDEEYEFTIDITIDENKSTESADYTIVFKANGTVEATSAVFSIQAGEKTYSDITISEFEYPMIPASGEGVSPVLSYSQTWGWNGITTGGGTITSGATLKYSGTNVNVSSGQVNVASRGTVILAQSTVTTASVTVTLNGKSASDSYNVQQAKNVPTAITPSITTYSYPKMGPSADTSTPSFGYSVQVKFSSGSILNLTSSSLSGATLTVARNHSLAAAVTGWSVASTTGVVTATSMGTTLGNRTGTVNVTTTFTLSPTSANSSLFSTLTKTASDSVALTQGENTRVIVYSKPNITDVSAADIPASGGSISSASVSYSQSRHYYYDSGVTENLSALTSGGTVNYGSPVTASSRGTTVGNRQLAGILTFTVSMNGQTSAEQDVSVYQQANEVSYGDVSLTVETPVNCDVLGGQYKITPTASQVLTYTSTATEAGDITFTYLEQAVPHPGFSLSGQYVNVTENESEVARIYQVTVLATGEGSKTSSGNVMFRQAAGVKSYGPVNITSFYYSQVPASGGVATPVLAYSQTWGWNDDTTSGGTITTGAAVSYSGTGVASSGSVSVPTKGTSVSSVTNYTLVTVKVTLNNIAAEATAYVTQAANAATSITYGTPSVSLTSAPDIPASGGSVSSGAMSYSQSRTQNYTSGATSPLAALTSGGSVSYSTVSASSLGTTVKSRTNVGTLTCTVTMNGKSGSDTCAVYQAANAVVSSEEGNYSTSITANRYTTSSSPCPASGGTATLSWSASYQTRNKYTSGSYDAWVSHSATPTISGSGTGFSRSGSTVTASNRGTTVGSLRSVTYSASYGTSSKSVTIYQQANSQNDAGITYGTWSVSVVANRYTSANSPCPAAGGTCTITRSATRTRVQNYSYTSGATSTASMTNESGTPTLSISGTGASLSGTTVTWASRGTTTGAARSATITANMSGVTATENVYQERNGGDTPKDYVFTVSPTTATVSAADTSYTFTVTSTYTLQYTSGAEETGLGTAYDVSSSSSWITANTNKVTFSQNTGSSRRSGSIVFTQVNSGKDVTVWLYQNAASSRVQLNITTQGNSGWNAAGTFSLITNKGTYICENVRLSGDSGGSASITINELNPTVIQIIFDFSGTLSIYSGTVSAGSTMYSSNYGSISAGPSPYVINTNISNPSTIWIDFNINY